MSRAFIKEDAGGDGLGGIGERPVSPHRNLVTRRGLDMIERSVAALREELGRTDPTVDRERAAMLARDLRYWSARRETAELTVPGRDSDVVRFGMRVTVEGADGTRRAWTIVGEDEADPAAGLISHVSPMARALFGKRVGDVAVVNGREWEIATMDVEA